VNIKTKPSQYPNIGDGVIGDGSWDPQSSVKKGSKMDGHFMVITQIAMRAVNEYSFIDKDLRCQFG